MGGSRLVGLMERFHAAAKLLGVGLEIMSLEDHRPWHAVGVSGLARIVSAPLFSDPGFGGFLLDVSAREGVDVIVPCIDKATVALAQAQPRLEAAGVLALCCGTEVCDGMADKAKADAIFRRLGLRVPPAGTFPLLAKPRFGASSRGIVLLRDREELEFWSRRNRAEDFVLQQCIEGVEYSVDAYVAGSGRMLGAVSRVREVVSGGEAMITRTEHCAEVESMTERLLAWDRWLGPVTVQAMYDGAKAWILECNPRFGSGVTCSIEAGLAVPEWILRERLALPLPEEPLRWRDGLCMTRSRRDHFLWLS